MSAKLEPAAAQGTPAADAVVVSTSGSVTYQAAGANQDAALDQAAASSLAAAASVADSTSVALPPATDLTKVGSTSLVIETKSSVGDAAAAASVADSNFKEPRQTATEAITKVRSCS